MSLQTFEGYIVTSALIILVGGLLAFIGTIMYFVMLLRLLDVPCVDSLVKIGAILIFVGYLMALLPNIGTILMFIGWLLVYLGITKSLTNPNLGIYPTPRYPPVPTQKGYPQQGYPQQATAAPQQGDSNPGGFVPVSTVEVACPHCGKDFEVP